MKELEPAFVAFTRERALELGPGLDWEKPSVAELLPDASSAAARVIPPDSTSTNKGSSPLTDWLHLPRGHDEEDPSRSRPGSSENDVSENLAKWIATHPTNFYALTEQAKTFIEQKQFQAAKGPLQKLMDLYPEETGPESSCAMLAAVHRALNETNAERQLLSRLAQQDDEAKDAYLRLMELSVQANDWTAVVQNANRYLAVDPLSAPPYRFLAQASEHTGETQSAIAAYLVLLQLDPPDPAEVHFHLAQAFQRKGDPAARRQVLEALEEAPRYQAAQALLLQIHSNTPPGSVTPPAAGAVAP
jgi:tetratricopeptide (TPR) repeat protein